MCPDVMPSRQVLKILQHLPVHKGQPMPSNQPTTGHSLYQSVTMWPTTKSYSAMKSLKRVMFIDSLDFCWTSHCNVPGWTRSQETTAKRKDKGGLVVDQMWLAFLQYMQWSARKWGLGSIS